MVKRGTPVSRILISILVGLILASVMVVAGSVTINLEDQVEERFGSDDRCGRSSDAGGGLHKCNTAVFSGSGPGGCSAEHDGLYSGCYFWETQGSRVNATSQFTITDAPQGAVGTLHVWTANFGGGTFLNEKVRVYVNGKYVGTTIDGFCNVENECPSQRGITRTAFANVKLNSGKNEITFTAVNGGGSVTVNSYKINYNPVVLECTPGDTEAQPCGNCGVKKRVCQPDGTWGEFSQCQAEGVCSPGSTDTRSCGTDVGVCTIGKETRTCTNSCQWTGFSACSGQGPGTEVCDTLDNDCDGSTDEGNVCVVSIPSCDLSFKPDKIIEGDITARILRTNDAASARVDCSGDIGSSSFSQIQDGRIFSHIFAPSESQECIATVYNRTEFRGESSVCKAKVYVNAPSPDPSCEMTFNPQEIASGEESQRLIETQNARSAQVECTGDFPDMKFEDFVEGRVFSHVQALTESQICIATVYEQPNFKGSSSTCKAEVIVHEEQEDPSCEMTFDPQEIASGEETRRLIATDNARSAQVECTGDFPDMNFEDFVEGKTFSHIKALLESQICVAKVYEQPNFKGDSSTCKAEVIVQEIQEDPSCILEFDPSEVLPGEETTRTVTTDNGRSAKVLCTGDFPDMNFESFEDGRVFTHTRAVNESQECVATVYAGENFTGKSVVCSDDVTVTAECRSDLDCDHLDQTFCDGTTITTREGVCENYQCVVEEVPVEDCSLRNGITGQCGILGWSCSEELNQVTCVISEITPDDSFCNDVCEGDLLKEGTCNTETYLCDYEITDCSELDNAFCQGSYVVEEEFTCETGACVMEEQSVENCNDGQFCNGQETCSAGACTTGTTVDCSVNNIPGVSTCFNVPDANSATFDYRAGFTSVCNEQTDSCTVGNETITHTCSKDVCNAQCEVDADCNPTECDQLDRCVGPDYYDYSDVQNSCTDSCGCTVNACSQPEISYDDPRCVTQVCGNGVLEPGEECEVGDTDSVSCGTDVGACTIGEKTRSCTNECTWNDFGVCSGQGPVQEVCNGIDDDCDGHTDEGNVCGPVCGNGIVEAGEECEIGDSEAVSCGTDVGACTIGQKTRACNAWCEWNDFGVCSGQGPQTEVCNDIDDDCDGHTDEGNVCGPVCGNGIVEAGEECEIGDSESVSCGTDVGACTIGEKTRSCNAWCEWNDFGVCSGQGPVTEVCDDRDNDCDGHTDEGNVCGPVCGNGIVEEGEECEIGDERTQSCGTDVGACTLGSQKSTCTNQCTWGDFGVCTGGHGPVEEICDDRDNDCDGQTDEGNVCLPPGVCPNGEVIMDDYSLRGSGGNIVRIGQFTDLDGETVTFSAVVNDVNSNDFRGYISFSARGYTDDDRAVSIRVKGQPTDIVQNTCTTLEVDNIWWSQNTYHVQGSAPQTITFDIIGYEWDRDAGLIDIFGSGPNVDFRVDDIAAVCLNCN